MIAVIALPNVFSTMQIVQGWLDRISRPVFFPQISILTYHNGFGYGAETKTVYFKSLLPFTSAIETWIQMELNQIDRYLKVTRAGWHSTKILKELKCEIAELLAKLSHKSTEIATMPDSQWNFHLQVEICDYNSSVHKEDYALINSLHLDLFSNMCL